MSRLQHRLRVLKIYIKLDVRDRNIFVKFCFYIKNIPVYTDIKNENFIKYGGGYYEKNCRSYFYAGCSIIFVRICILSCKNFSCIRPPLTDLQIIGITSDGNDNEWEIISPNQLSAITPLKGRNIRIAIYVEGTERPGFLRIYNGGRDITSQNS